MIIGPLLERCHLTKPAPSSTHIIKDATLGEGRGREENEKYFQLHKLYLVHSHLISHLKHYFTSASSDPGLEYFQNIPDIFHPIAIPRYQNIKNVMSI